MNIVIRHRTLSGDKTTVLNDVRIFSVSIQDDFYEVVCDDDVEFCNFYQVRYFYKDYLCPIDVFRVYDLEVY